MTGLSIMRTGLICAALLFGASNALAQQPANKMGPAFTQNRGQPIQITAESLEVRDKEKVATFSGKVCAIQGDTALETAKLIVFYEGDATGSGAPPAAGQAAGNSQIKRLEAKGGVILTQKDQIATGNEGIYDMKSDMVTLTGDATASQGDNFIRGYKIIVNMKTGLTRVEPKPGETVSSLFKPNEQKQPQPEAKLARNPNCVPSVTGKSPPNPVSASAPNNSPVQPAPRRDASQPAPRRDNAQPRRDTPQTAPRRDASQPMPLRQ